jgi:hypothetical protein
MEDRIAGIAETAEGMLVIEDKDTFGHAKVYVRPLEGAAEEPVGQTAGLRARAALPVGAVDYSVDLVDARGPEVAAAAAVAAGTRDTVAPWAGGRL